MFQENAVDRRKTLEKEFNSKDIHLLNCLSYSNVLWQNIFAIT